ncbi:MAG TPA: S41 family peptidase [Stellaceae bacterium]|jgi:carboxyl-terminal processing protease|nr:S41 family peptidase [Stellaceae bacterium]
MRVRKLAVLILAMASVAPVAALAQQQPQQGGGKDAVYEELNLFDEAFERIRQDAVDPVADSKLVGAAISGMLTGLDPHASYIDAAALKALNEPTAAGDVGIGAALTLTKGELKVISPRDGSPAAAVGIKPGDLILAIDKEPTYELTLAEAEQKLRGPAGSTVALTLQRGEEGAPLKLTVKRAADHMQTVSARIEDGNLGYLRLAGFDAGTGTALAAAVQDLRQQSGGKLAGVVVDLRNNPGGNFKDAVATANAFLDKGDVALVKGHNSDNTKHIAVTPNDLVKGLPIVALVNGGTADEAELVAGALQDNHRALLLGTKTFGESAIETLIPLASGGAIRLTTARFTTPDGREIDGKGLDPDLTVTPLKLEKLAKEEGLHEADLPGALKNPDQPAAASAGGAPSPAAGQPAPATKAAPPGAPPGATATPAAKTAPSVATGDMGGASDEQLTQALDVLRGLAVFNLRAAG